MLLGSNSFNLISKEAMTLILSHNVIKPIIGYDRAKFVSARMLEPSIAIKRDRKSVFSCYSLFIHLIVAQATDDINIALGSCRPNEYGDLCIQELCPLMHSDLSRFYYAQFYDVLYPAISKFYLGKASPRFHPNIESVVTKI